MARYGDLRLPVALLELLPQMEATVVAIRQHMLAFGSDHATKEAQPIAAELSHSRFVHPQVVVRVFATLIIVLLVVSNQPRHDCHTNREAYVEAVWSARGAQMIMVLSIEADNSRIGCDLLPSSFHTGGCHRTECTQSLCPARTDSSSTQYRTEAT